MAIGIRYPTGMSRILLILVATALMSGCAGLADRLGLNAPGELVPLVPPENVVTMIEERALVESVTDITVARVSGGAMVRAGGVVRRLGAHNLQLVSEGVEDGTLTLSFRVAYPDHPTASGSEFQRQVNAAEVVSPDELRGVRRISVAGASNSRTAVFRGL
ncbi:MAG: hypothetical protein AAF330_00790 [Pseudomonadota bacterium]